MRIHFYGRLIDLAGSELELIGEEPKTVAELRSILAERHPRLTDEILSASSRAFVDDAMVPDTHPLAGVAAVEFLPPVSGG